MERRIKLVFQGAGDHPWILDRRRGLVRGIRNRLKADRFFTGPQILAEAQWCLNSRVSASGCSAYQLVLGSNPTDLYGRGDTDEDLLFAQDTSISGQSARQWQLRIRAQEAALKEIANSRPRRLLAYNKTFDCVGIKVGDSALCYKAPHKKSNARWTGSATILDIDESGVALKAARYCVPDLQGGAVPCSSQIGRGRFASRIGCG